ncbi:MAG: HAMP domain-containing sensor histidine kinase [Bacillota bacterium]|nr:HAMP domain-containing sensor histidine kinase [Bacillota bacterium]
MRRNEAKSTTTLRQYLKWFLIALIAGIIAFALVYQMGMFMIDRHMSGDAYQKNNKQTYVEPFCDYVTANSIESTDSKDINGWIESKKDVAVKIFDGKRVIYENYYFDYSRPTYSMTEFLHTTKLEYLTVYPVKFADGTFDVYINSAKGDRVYYVLLFLTMIVGIVVLCAVFITGITRRARYITQLKNDMEILGSGDLTHKITIKGNDDLTYIAENLEQMRAALLKHTEEEERLAKGNKEIVSKLSHDIRTPLTSMTLFADLLKDGRYQNEEQRNHYIERIHSGVTHLTQLTDQLLDYTRGEKPANRNAKAIQTDFSQLIEQATEELRLRGFIVETDCKACAANINIEISAATRIMDNIISNIVRYADDKEPVKICSRSENSGLILEFSNAIADTVNDFKGEGVGLKSVETIMNRAGGEASINTINNRFIIRLTFNNTTK